MVCHIGLIELPGPHLQHKMCVSLQAQTELYNNGSTSAAAHLVQGILDAPQPGAHVFKVDVTIWLPQVIGIVLLAGATYAR